MIIDESMIQFIQTTLKFIISPKMQHNVTNLILHCNLIQPAKYKMQIQINGCLTATQRNFRLFSMFAAQVQLYTLTYYNYNCTTGIQT